MNEVLTRIQTLMDERKWTLHTFAVSFDVV